uniref:Relaxin receptor 1-like n=1 Tax=Phallusia mammillata TaxID=59560 RepID=A0A6F9DQW4_9ASCI|nr:relaxin receptor 1-like [Phallusia mammillata]
MALKNPASQSASLRANHMLVLNLAVADLLMGVYLLMLGAIGTMYSGNYCVNDLLWRSSDTCSAMGILVVLSSEASVLTMVLLTSFRIYAVWNPFNAGTKPSGKVVIFALLLVWFVACLLAFLPLGVQFQHRFTTTAMINESPFFQSIMVEYSSFKSFLERFLTFGPKFNRSDVTASKLATLDKALSWFDLSTILQNSKHNKYALSVKRYFGYVRSTEEKNLETYHKLKRIITNICTLASFFFL